MGGHYRCLINMNDFERNPLCTFRQISAGGKYAIPNLMFIETDQRLWVGGEIEADNAIAIGWVLRQWHHQCAIQLFFGKHAGDMKKRFTGL